ncbi:F-box protein SKIP23-like [Elaeis guineensis]|uniref:F-box protein SKIP23-like n=1 Tax=Elaeis guineensis var. tenera TaxID=51953 RepID=A0A8N4FCK2_ELAGV|nr:F-box protein SKIP23-like [Elaeis guineensis]
MDCSTMIPDLLKRISDKLPCCLDYFHFRLVCTHWRSAARPKKFPPIFILPSNSDSAELRFFDRSDGGVHPLRRLESTRNKTICGASRGWLALIDDTTKSISLVNPITGVQYPLPPAPQELDFDFHELMKDHYISDVFMSSVPNSGSECIVMAKQSGFERFVFCWPGDAVWTPLRTSYEICEVVAFWNGRFYAVDHDEDVLALEFGSRDEGIMLSSQLRCRFAPSHANFWNVTVSCCCCMLIWMVKRIP